MTAKDLTEFLNSNNKYIKEASMIIRYLNEDEAKKFALLSQEKYETDRKIEIKRAIKAEDLKCTMEEIAINLLKSDLFNDTIVSYSTGLSFDKIKELKEINNIK